MSMMEKLDKYIARAEADELEKPMRPEAVEALKAAVASVAFGYPSLEECLMGVTVYEEAEKLYFEDDDEFPLKYISALKSVVMMSEIEKDVSEVSAPETTPDSPRAVSKPGKKRPSKRRQKIHAEIKTFVKQAEEQELEKEMREEGVTALTIAAEKLAYKKKYYDMSQNKFQIFPSVAALLVGYEIYEEAEKHYYDPEDEYPLKYIAALKEVAMAGGGMDEDTEEMEPMAVEIASDDDVFNSTHRKGRSVKERRSVFESGRTRHGSVGRKPGTQEVEGIHPLVSPSRRKKITNHAFNQRMSMYTQRDDEKKQKLKKLEFMRQLNKKGVETVEKGMVGLVTGKFNDQVKEHEESFKQEILSIQERKKRLRESKEKIREQKNWNRNQMEVKEQVQAMNKKKKLLASIENLKGSTDVDLWSNVRATTIEVDHKTYEPPKNLPNPSPDEKSLLVDVMEQSVLFHPHREAKDTRTALVQAFEKFDITEGEEFVQKPEDNFFYVVKEGSVDFTADGKVVGTAKKGEHFGELNLLYAGDPSAPQDSKRKFNLVANENSTLMRLNQAVFREILQVQTKKEEDVKKEYLKKVPFLRNLLFNGDIEKNKQTTSLLLSIMVTRKFKEGEKILDDDSNPEDSLFIMKEGKVQLTTDKKEVFHLVDGSYIGKRALMASKGKEPNVQDLEGLSDGVLYQIEKDAVNRKLGMNFFARQFDVAQDKKKLEGFQCIKSVNLDPEIMEEIAQNIEDKKFEEGKQILEEGADTEPCLYLVREGFVTLSTNNGEFKQKVGPGGYFGVEQLLVPKDRSKPAQASKKVLVPAQWSVSVTGSSPCICGVLPLQDVQDALNGESIGDLKDKFDESGFDVVLQPDGDDSRKSVERMPSMTRPKIKSAVETPEGQMIINKRLERREAIKKSAPKLDDLEMVSVLGDGEFGEVWLVSAGGHNFALKMQEKKDEETEEAIDREISVTKELCHPNIVDLVTTYNAGQSVYMLLGLVPGGELWELIYREGDDGSWSSGLPEPKARFYALIIADTLSWLHSEKYLYRDLKPENVMIDADGYPILVDFGFAKKFDHDLTFTFCGTPNYVAPEIVKNTGHNAGVDHWALGVLIYEMLSGEHPFFAEGMRQMQVFEAICQDAPYPLQTNVSEAALSLIHGLLEKDHTQRLGMLANKQRDILEHSWFSGVDLFDLRSRKTEAPFLPEKK
eukprot:scaffold3103_cov136-Cylindrotheca_fusiformis.AAC.6